MRVCGLLRQTRAAPLWRHIPLRFVSTAGLPGPHNHGHDGQGRDEKDFSPPNHSHTSHEVQSGVGQPASADAPSTGPVAPGLAQDQTDNFQRFLDQYGYGKRLCRQHGHGQKNHHQDMAIGPSEASTGFVPWSDLLGGPSLEEIISSPRLSKHTGTFLVPTASEVSAFPSPQPAKDEESPPSHSSKVTDSFLNMLQRRYSSLKEQQLDRGHIRWWNEQLTRVSAMLPLGAHDPMESSALQAVDVKDLRERWERRRDHQRSQAWEKVMLTALERHPAQAHMALAALAPTAPLSFMVEDVIGCLMSWQERQGFSEAEIESYANFMGRLLWDTIIRLEPDERVFHGIGIASVFRFSSLDFGIQLRDLLNQNKIPISPFATARLVGRLCDSVEHRDKAISELVQLCHYPPENAEAWWSLVASITTRILTAHAGSDMVARRAIQEGGAGVEAREERLAQYSELMSLLAEKGLALNLVHYTAWIRSMCLEGMPDMALQTVESLLGQNLAMDKHVYSILFNGAKEHKALDVMERALELASQQDLMGTVLWNDMLHTVFAYWNQEQGWKKKKNVRTFERDPCLPYMVRYYNRIFETAPLTGLVGQDLVACDTHGVGGDSLQAVFPLLDRYIEDKSADGKVEPGSDTLVIMLIAYIKDLKTMHGVFSFFIRFTKLLDEGNEVASLIVQQQTTRIHNAVIKRLGELKGHGAMRLCRSVLFYMLKGQSSESTLLELSKNGPRDSAQSGEARPSAATKAQSTSLDAQSADLGARRPQPHPEPDVRTWSILMHAYFCSQDLEGAKGILEDMQAHGIEPNIVTWNTLAGGYGFHQDYDATIESVRHIHEHRLQPDQYTSKSVLRLNDHAQALEMLKADVAKIMPVAVATKPKPRRNRAHRARSLQRELDYLSGLASGEKGSE